MRVKNYIIWTIYVLSFSSSSLYDLQCLRICEETCSHLPLLYWWWTAFLATPSLPSSSKNIPATTSKWLSFVSFVPSPRSKSVFLCGDKRNALCLNLVTSIGPSFSETLLPQEFSAPTWFGFRFTFLLTVFPSYKLMSYIFSSIF